MIKIQTNIGEINYNNNLNDADKMYHDLLVNILSNGIWKESRTGIKTLSIFGPQLKFDISKAFPLITTKKIHWKSIIGELLWFLSGSTNKFELKEKYGVSIWDEWGNNETGELGPIYGKQWISWKTYNNKIHKDKKGNNIYIPIVINQIDKLISFLKNDPDNRRMLVSAWNPAEIAQMALPPCHWSFQCYTSINKNGNREISMIMNIRSWDTFLGGPFNIAEYALLLMILGREVNMIPKNLIINAGDAHIYENHIPYVIEQLQRDSKSLPSIQFLNIKDIYEYTPDDIMLISYDAHPNWKNVPVAI